MKKILMVLLIFSMLVGLVGCQGSDLESYGEATKKTDAIKKGQMDLSMEMAFDVDTQNMTEEEIKASNYFKMIEGEMTIQFDDEEGKFISRNYFNFGGLGFDSALYRNGEESYLQMPILGKYIKMDGLDEPREVEKETALLTEETMDHIGGKWLDLLQEDDVFSGKSTIMETPDGEVKVTEYNIHMEGEQLKEFGLYALDEISRDPLLKENLSDGVNLSKDNKINPQELIQDTRNMLQGSGVESFDYKVYVDIDGYIVKEIIEVHIDVKGEEVNGATFNMTMNRWDIEKEQNFEFPEITEENTLKEDELDQGMPFMFEELDQ